MEIKFEGIAMSKKKTTKVLTSEEKRRSRKYRFLLGFFIALNLTFFIFYDSLAALLVTSFYKIRPTNAPDQAKDSQIPIAAAGPLFCGTPVS